MKTTGCVRHARANIRQNVLKQVLQAAKRDNIGAFCESSELNSAAFRLLVADVLRVCIKYTLQLRYYEKPVRVFKYYPNKRILQQKTHHCVSATNFEVQVASFSCHSCLEIWCTT